MLDAIDEDINAGVITQAEGDRLREEKAKPSNVEQLEPGLFMWVDLQFRQWIRGRALSFRGRVEVVIAIEDAELERGQRWVQDLAKQCDLDIPDEWALEIFSLCLAYRNVDRIEPSETVVQAINACLRRAAKVGQG
jgi:hypothetical protein